jgi:hypothetical protein
MVENLNLKVKVEGFKFVHLQSNHLGSFNNWIAPWGFYLSM